MKKIFVLFASVVFAVAAQAQRVIHITGIEKQGTAFFVKAGDKVLQINPYLYKRIKANPKGYVYVEYIGEKASAQTVCQTGKISYSVTSVDSIGLDANDNAEVYLSDATVYHSTNDEWLRVNKGQHVERWLIDGETKVITHTRTVPRDVALTKAYPVEYPNGPNAPIDDLAQVTPPAAQTPIDTTTPTQQPTATKPVKLVRK